MPELDRLMPHWNVKTLPRPTRLLVISAHPGEADMAIGGTVAQWVDAGTVATLVCGTSGDSSGDDAAADPLELAARREGEQREAASILGYADVMFLHRPDGALVNDLALREQLVRIIRAIKPDAVASRDPRVTIDGDGAVVHIDRREAGLASLDAVEPAARRAMAFPHLASSEGLAPHRVGHILLFGSDRPDPWVDISDTLQAKVEAVRCHASDLEAQDRLERLVRDRASTLGEASGVAAAEAFDVLDLA